MQRKVLIEGYRPSGREIFVSGTGQRGYQPVQSAKPVTQPPPPKGGSAVSKPVKK